MNIFILFSSQYFKVGSAAFQKTVGKTNIRPANIESCFASLCFVLCCLNKQVRSYQPVCFLD